MRALYDNLTEYLRAHGDEVTATLALIVLAELAVIFLWARRVTVLRRRLADAEEAAGTAANAAAAALSAGRLALADQADGVHPVLRSVPAPVEAEPAMPRAEPAGAAVAPPPPPPAPAADQAAEAAPDWSLPPDDDIAPRPPAAAAAAWASPPPDPDPEPVETRPEPPAPVPAALPVAAAGPETVTPAPAPAATLPEPEVAAPAAGFASWLSPGPMAEPPRVVRGSAGAEGSEHSVVLALLDEASVPEEPLPPPSPRRDHGRDVLLVEDDTNVARLYRMLLENKGYTVRHAADGVDGLDEARRTRPDLVLLDVMMPRMNGITFLQTLRADDGLRDVPVVVLSNFREPRLVERALNLGAIEYMVKAQTRPEALVGALPHWLRGERAFSA